MVYTPKKDVNVLKAINIAATYLDSCDSSDHYSALWEIIEELAPDLYGSDLSPEQIVELTKERD